MAHPELVPALQTALLKFVYGKEPKWPVYGKEHRIFNISSEGYLDTPLPGKLKERCDILNDIFLDPANGV